MNFLAHLYLSGNNSGIKTGNFIADFLKGSKFGHLPNDIRKGIEIHRFIDSFTDNHRLVAQSKEPLRQLYGKYAGVITDIFYDHLLAAQWDKYSLISLNQFTVQVYYDLFKNYCYIPAELKLFLPHFILFQRLKSYQHLKGIQVVLEKMSVRFGIPFHASEAVEILISRYDDYTSEFNNFFPEIIHLVSIRFQVKPGY